MHLQIKKKKAKAKLESKKEAVVCVVCNHERKTSDTNPKWQCPCCKVEYNKAEKLHKHMSKHELKEANHKYMQRKQKNSQIKTKKNKLELSLLTGSAGVMSVISGLGYSCACSCQNLMSRASTNPWLLVVGGVLVLAGLVLGLSYFSN